jgi:phosphoribosylaminoimidazole (AIR) synthetase
MDDEPRIERKECKRLLVCDLTPTEIREAGESMAEAVESGQRLEEELKQVKQEYKFKIDSSVAEINRLSNLIRARKERRTVDCEEVFNYDDGSVRVVRQDTMDTVEEREMNDNERQQWLALQPAEVE